MFKLSNNICCLANTILSDSRFNAMYVLPEGRIKLFSNAAIF